MIIPSVIPSTKDWSVGFGLILAKARTAGRVRQDLTDRQVGQEVRMLGDERDGVADGVPERFLGHRGIVDEDAPSRGSVREPLDVVDQLRRPRAGGTDHARHLPHAEVHPRHALGLALTATPLRGRI